MAPSTATVVLICFTMMSAVKGNAVAWRDNAQKARLAVRFFAHWVGVRLEAVDAIMLIGEV